jgi:hypothetical protein
MLLSASLADNNRSDVSIYRAGGNLDFDDGEWVRSISWAFDYSLGERSTGTHQILHSVAFAVRNTDNPGINQIARPAGFAGCDDAPEE